MERISPSVGHAGQELTPPVRDAEKETADAASSTDSYARRFAGKAGAWMIGVQTATVLAMLLDLEEGAVLDVGGGHAQVTPMLQDKGYSVQTVVSEGASTSRLNSMGVPRKRIIVGDLMNLPLADRSFDAVVSMRMIAHVQDVSGYLGELCRVAGQIVVVDYTCSHGLGAFGERLFRTKRFLEGDTRRYTVLDRSEIVEVFERNGFVMDQHVGQFALPVVLHRMLRSARVSKLLEGLLRPLARRYGNPVILRARRRNETS